MALFQKKPVVESVMPLYSLSSNKTILIVGLGNIGAEYEGTRHNIGFAALDAFAESNDFPAWVNKKDLKAEITQATLGDTRVILAKPTTFMNESGQAVQAIANFYKIGAEHIIVVHDELDIDFGQIRCRVGGGAAGNNGQRRLCASEILDGPEWPHERSNTRTHRHTHRDYLRRRPASSRNPQFLETVSVIIALYLSRYRELRNWHKLTGQ